MRDRSSHMRSGSHERDLFGWPWHLLVLFLVAVWMGPGWAESPSDRPIRQAGRLSYEKDNGGIELPEGFRAVIVADNLGPARHVAVRDNGDVYVALRKPHRGGSIVALRDTGGDGKADIVERFGEMGGTGIEIRKEFLYFGSPIQIVRYPLQEGSLVPKSPPDVIVKGFPRQAQHAAKSFAMDEAGSIYVNIGAPSNACQKRTRTRGSPGMDPCPQLERHAGIWRFQADEVEQRYTGPENRFATGIRNAVAIAWNPVGRRLYLVQHGRDQLHDLWPDLYTVVQNAELPSEEFLMVDARSDFGWPYCYYDHVQGKKVLAPEYGGDGKRVGPCDQFGDPIMAFPGHWAPNDLLFYTGNQFPEHYYGGAFIAFHGSWNRAPLEQAGYKVVFVPFKERIPSGAWEVFGDGFAGPGTVQRPRDARFRPMGLAEGPDGSVYISDSVRGRIWRVVYDKA